MQTKNTKMLHKLGKQDRKDTLVPECEGTGIRARKESFLALTKKRVVAKPGKHR
jgi:hypothetical protein